MNARGLVMALVSGLLVVSGGRGTNGAVDGSWQETRFWTGCAPGPAQALPWPEHVDTHIPPPGPGHAATLRVDLDSAGAHQPLLGSGFNFEHALWSCPDFRSVFEPEILGPFAPAVARVDTGLLPAAPADLPADQLGPDVYLSMLASPAYGSSWDFMRELQSQGVRIVLGIWGGPAQFTDDGTRRGTLLPQHYDDYVDYVATVVDYIVRMQGVQVWATTIANEPDGGDGNQIPPEGFAYIAQRLADRLTPIGVRLYGPDTTNADSAMQYLPLLLDDSTIASSLAFAAFHEYYANPDVATVVDYVHSRDSQLPVIVTEYTSFGFGDLDAGQEVDDRVGFTLDVVNTLLSHYQNGVDAALYWDAIDYLQPGHDAITRWGLLRGPARDFARRTRYFGLLQVLPYLRAGTHVLSTEQDGIDALSSLAVRTASGATAIFLVNQSTDPVNLQLDMSSMTAAQPALFALWRTDRHHKADQLDPVSLTSGSGTVSLPPRSLTTLVNTG